jgi:hypothetical protein
VGQHFWARGYWVSTVAKNEAAVRRYIQENPLVPILMEKRKAARSAESFQWINLMRGDTSFMSLVNHRYLTTRPNEKGPLTADATGPSPARKDGACFKWKAVD